MHRILFISDDLANKKPLKSGLLESAMAVTSVTSAEVTGDGFLPPDRLDVIVIDLERFATDLARLCRVLKGERSLREVPLIALLPEAQLGRIDFGVGIDDYLTLPVSPKRLVERLNFLAWKLHRAAPKNGCSFGSLVVDFERYEVHVGGQPVDLTYKEFELLKFFATHPGKPFTREVLLDKVWGYDYYGGTRTVDVHIRRLRAKIESDGGCYIETVRNVGYKFLAPTESSL